MRGTDFDELAFFQTIHRSGARALLIGRRALVVLGLPVLTADYDFWIAIDDIAAFNGAAADVALTPTVEADAARRRGRYVLENDEHVEVLVTRAVLALVRWFRRRYQTPAARLAYARRTYARWSRGMGRR